MSFQVHSELVKVAELTLLALKHHLFQNWVIQDSLAAFHFPAGSQESALPDKCRCAYVTVAVELTTGEQGSWL